MLGGGSQSSRRLGQIQLLVCSANLGNAAPDAESFAAWIPADGSWKEVVTSSSSSFPDSSRAADLASATGLDPTQGEDPLLGNSEKAPVQQLWPEVDVEQGDEEEDPQFDIIVIGMQESTFDPPNTPPPPPPPTARPVTAQSAPDLLETTVTTTESTTLPNSGSSPLSSTSVENPPTAATTTTSRRFVRVNMAAAVAPQKIRRGVQKVSRLTTNRDYTKREALSSSVSSTDTQGRHSSWHRLYSLTDWNDGTTVLHALLEARLPSYQRQVSFQRGEMRLEILVHQGKVELGELEVQVLHVAAQNTGRGGLANKGGIVAELLINRTTRVTLVTCHLEAHEGLPKYWMRCHSLADILQGTRRGLPDLSQTSHVTVLLGDLNFRTQIAAPTSSEPLLGSLAEAEESGKAQVYQWIAQQDWARLNEADELAQALRCRDCLADFQTPPCLFPPTFKLERQKGYQYVDKRIPSYTDRIMYKTNHGLDSALRLWTYEPIADFASSDHKPVRAAMTVTLNEPLHMRPKMTRRRSMYNLAGLLSKADRQHPSGMLVQRERLHLFVSEMRCTLDSAKVASSSYLPNPYICLYSCPEEALQMSSTWSGSMWLMRSVSFIGRRRPNAQDAMTFPKSSVKKRTLQPNWRDEEVQCALTTHAPDGSPLNLSGAMLVLTVMDTRSQGDHAVLGSYALNLANLIRSSGAWAPKAKGPHQQQPHQGMGPMSMLKMLGPSSKPNLADARGEDSDPFVGVHVDAPLLRNGVETGRIMAHVEAWWMNESTAHVIQAKKTAPGSHPIATAANGPRAILSPRHTDRKAVREGK